MPVLTSTENDRLILVSKNFPVNMLLHGCESTIFPGPYLYLQDHQYYPYEIYAQYPVR